MHTATPVSPFAGPGSSARLIVHAERGGTAFGHVNHVTIHQAPDAPPPRPVRSTYLEQVRRIAPPELLGRQAELGELAGFCTDGDRGPYVWWRAGPWAGKSALMSTFVLQPPAALVAAGVRIVSFFITARLASQDNRDAFTTVLLEQLCELTGQTLPAVVSEATREGFVLDLLAQAAAACRTAGGRLVLLVDGLDEDRGATLGPDAHSIAGLLPAEPPAGMRIIVTGRPNPPVPDDVPDWHPLRDPGIVRLLGDSPHARDLQRLGQAELKRLLRGSPVEQDLLGLLTAARGGLSGPDLRELTSADLVHIEDVLHTVAGRTFTRRAATWDAHDGPEVYLLGHEELHHAAEHYLGSARLAGYRDRLHTWADSYRTAGPARPSWPVGTPQYLLSGYTRMLHATGAGDRLFALATDPVRHDRMLDLSGGDAAALAEIVAGQDLILAHPEPDLFAMALLSRRRQDLVSRNTNIPADLPAVWATLGQSARAEALARGIADPGRQEEALAQVAVALAGAGDADRAVEVAHGITDPDQQAKSLARIAVVVAEAGHADRATSIAHSITDPYKRAGTLAKVAVASAMTGDVSRAVSIARGDTALLRSGPSAAGDLVAAHEQANALTLVAVAVAGSGDVDRAVMIARTITGRRDQGRALADVAAAVAGAGDPARAETIAATITDPQARTTALTRIAAVVAGSRDTVQARRLTAEAATAARTVQDAYYRAQRLAEVAAVVATTGDAAGAARLTAEAEALARAITDPAQREGALTQVAGALRGHGSISTRSNARLSSRDRDEDLVRSATVSARVGDPDRAVAIARAITDPDRRARALAGVAATVAEAKNTVLAAQLATEAESVARAIVDLGGRAEASTQVAAAVAGAGDIDRAVTIAGTIANRRRRARAMAAVAAVVAGTGDPARAETIARTITTTDWRALAALAAAVARAGDTSRAVTIARAIADPGRRAAALAGIAVERAGSAGTDETGRLVAEAESIARAVTDPDERAIALIRVAAAVARVCSADPALTIARSLTHPGRQAEALAEVAVAVAGAGDTDRAQTIARSITHPDWRALAWLALLIEDGATDHVDTVARGITSPVRRAEALTQAATAVARAGEHSRAETIARAITHPDRQADALAQIAGAVAATGDTDRAEAVARGITDPDRRAQALTRVAEIAGLPGAARLLAEAFAAGSWLIPLPALARIQPNVLLRIAAAWSATLERQ